MTESILPDGVPAAPKAPGRPVRLGVKGRARVKQAREEATREPNRKDPNRLQRTRKRSEDRLYVDPKIIPAGISYEWKRESFYGKSDKIHINELMDNHWKPVPKDRHPGLITERDGLILMERPAYLTDEATEENFNEAMGREAGQRQEIRQTPAGQFTREHPSASQLHGVKVSYGNAVPEE